MVKLTIFDNKHPDYLVVSTFLELYIRPMSSDVKLVFSFGAAAPSARVMHLSVPTFGPEDAMDLIDAPLTIMKLIASRTLAVSSEEESILSGFDALEWAKISEWITFARVDFLQQSNPARRDVLLRLLDRWLSQRTFVASPHRLSIADLFLFVYLRDSIMGITEKGREYGFTHLCRYYSHLQSTFNSGDNDELVALLGEPIALFARAAGKRPSFKFVPHVAKANAAAADAKAKKQQQKQPQQQGKGATVNGGAKQQSKKDKKEKKKEKKGGAATPSASASGVPVPISALEMRAGKILSVKRHPNADGLYVEEIDVGEPEPRTVCSGLVGKVEMESKVGAMVLVATNLKPSTMRGIASQAMVFAATNSEGDVDLVSIPDGVQPGERVVVDNFDGEPDKQLNSKRLVKILPLMKTSQESGEVVFADDKNVLRFPSNGKAAFSAFKGAEVK